MIKLHDLQKNKTYPLGMKTLVFILETTEKDTSL